MQLSCHACDDSLNLVFTQCSAEIGSETLTLLAEHCINEQDPACCPFSTAYVAFLFWIAFSLRSGCDIVRACMQNLRNPPDELQSLANASP